MRNTSSATLHSGQYTHKSCLHGQPLYFRDFQCLEWSPGCQDHSQGKTVTWEHVASSLASNTLLGVIRERWVRAALPNGPGLMHRGSFLWPAAYFHREKKQYFLFEKAGNFTTHSNSSLIYFSQEKSCPVSETIPANPTACISFVAHPTILANYTGLCKGRKYVLNGCFVFAINWSVGRIWHWPMQMQVQ